MSSKRIYLLTILTLLNLWTFSQSSRYFKNFDFYTMQGVDTLANINSWPDFFIKCSYDNSGKLIGIDASSKVSFNYLHAVSHITVLNQKEKILLFLGAGKQREGYTRGVFQKKIYSSDSAFVTHDTLLYKFTSDKYIRVQYFTKINTDSIFFSETIYPFRKKKDMKLSKLSSFTFYKEWFAIDTSVTRIISGIILLKQDPLLVWNDTKGISYRINITKASFKDIMNMPITFFWLKNSGLLY